MTAEADIAALLRDIRDQQRTALELQRKHMALYRTQLDRVERINNRAEALQARSSRAIRLIMVVALPLAFLLLALMLWPYLTPFWK